jgi:DNA topoisomerase IB
VDERGRRVADDGTLERIRALAIPPAWEDVWICPFETGHIQAVGTDVRGRKQYRYHDDWRRRRDREKFEQMLDFGRALPRLRRRVAKQVQGTEPTRERVLAGAVRLLDRGFFRIGGESYAEENNSYGLATMLKRHVRLERRNVLVFDFPAKSGQRRGGSDELLAYRNGRRWHDVRSADINEHVKAMAGGDFSAKNFRTWNATVLAAVEVARAGPGATSRTARQRVISEAVESVASYLGNTPAVARASYIDPRVFDRFDAGVTIAGALSNGEPDLDDPAVQRRVERAVLDLLSDEDGPA